MKREYEKKCENDVECGNSLHCGMHDVSQRKACICKSGYFWDGHLCS